MQTSGIGDKHGFGNNLRTGFQLGCFGIMTKRNFQKVCFTGCCKTIRLLHHANQLSVGQNNLRHQALGMGCNIISIKCYKLVTQFNLLPFLNRGGKAFRLQ